MIVRNEESSTEIPGPPKRLLRNSPMPRGRQFPEDRKEPSANFSAPRASLATPRGPNIGATLLRREGPHPFPGRRVT